MTLSDLKGARILNMEFKAGGISPESTNVGSIHKDLQKLVQEADPGMWFHLLQSADSGSISKLLTAFAQQLCAVIRAPEPWDKPKLLILHLLVLRQGFSLHKSLLLAEPIPSDSDVVSMLGFSYRIRRDKLEIKGENGWSVAYR